MTPMNPVKVIIRKEINVASNTMLIYIAFIAFFCITGVVYWLSPQNIFYTGQASLAYLFNVLYDVLYFLIPVLTMKSIAAEKKDGTFQLLFSKPIKTWQLLMGKYLAIQIEVLVCLALTLPYYITIASLGHVDHAVGFCGYLGLVFVTGCYISVGIFASSLTNNPLVAFFSTFAITIWFQFLFELIGTWLRNTFLSGFFSYLSVSEHFDTISRGIIDTQDIIFFLSVITLFLALARYVICRSRI